MTIHDVTPRIRSLCGPPVRKSDSFVHGGKKAAAHMAVAPEHDRSRNRHGKAKAHAGTQAAAVRPALSSNNSTSGRGRPRRSHSAITSLTTAGVGVFTPSCVAGRVIRGATFPYADRADERVAGRQGTRGTESEDAEPASPHMGQRRHHGVEAGTVLTASASSTVAGPRRGHDQAVNTPIPVGVIGGEENMVMPARPSRSSLAFVSREEPRHTSVDHPAKAPSAHV